MNNTRCGFFGCQGDEEMRVAERNDSDLISHFSTDYWRRSLLVGAPGSSQYGGRGMAIPRSRASPGKEPGVSARSITHDCGTSR